MEGIRASAVTTSQFFNGTNAYGINVRGPLGVGVLTNSYGISVFNGMAGTGITTDTAVGIAVDRQNGAVTKNIALWIAHITPATTSAASGICYGPSADTCMWRHLAGVVAIANNYTTGGNNVIIAAAASGTNAYIAATANNLKIGRAVGSALSTTATDGFPMLPASAGVPTGVPTGASATDVPIEVDTTNNRLYYYSSSSWRTPVSALSCTGLGCSCNSSTGICTITYPGPVPVALAAQPAPTINSYGTAIGLEGSLSTISGTKEAFRTTVNIGTSPSSGGLLARLNWASTTTPPVCRITVTNPEGTPDPAYFMSTHSPKFYAITTADSLDLKIASGPSAVALPASASFEIFVACT